tara:strand:+ start:297 stop:1364 length:1068 start_codon:yes stop_codon:yes gene_type:complete
MDGSENTPLLLAIEKGNNEEAFKLIKNSEYINQANRRGTTPLLLAIHKGNNDVVRMLLDKGANIDQADSEGTTPLLLAIEKSNMEEKSHNDIVGLLIEAGANVNLENIRIGKTPLFLAVEKSHSDIVRLLIEAGANVNHEKNPTVSGRETALLIACDILPIEKEITSETRKLHNSIVLQLIEAGANVNYKNKRGRTALSNAAFRGWIDIVKLLAGAGADIPNKNVMEDGIGGPTLEQKAFADTWQDEHREKPWLVKRIRDIIKFLERRPEVGSQELPRIWVETVPEPAPGERVEVESEKVGTAGAGWWSWWAGLRLHRRKSKKRKSKKRKSKRKSKKRKSKRKKPKRKKTKRNIK